MERSGRLPISLSQIETNHIDENWIAIGDIHASAKSLNEILRQAETYPTHRLIFLGDYFDYGQELPEVLDTFLSLNRITTFLMGNHEFEFLNFYHRYGMDDRKQMKILNHFQIGMDHLHWIQNELIYSYENHSAFFSHAGIDDRKNLKEQSQNDLLYSGFRENLDHVTKKYIIQGHIPGKTIRKYGNHIFVDTGCGIGENFLLSFIRK